VLHLQRFAGEKMALLQSVLIYSPSDVDNRKCSSHQSDYQQRDHSREDATSKDESGLRLGRAIFSREGVHEENPNQSGMIAAVRHGATAE